MSCLVIGEALIDEIAGRDGLTRRLPGGSMLNVAIGLRHLDRTVRLVTDLGLDSDGQILTSYADENGLELWLPSDEERNHPTSVAHASVLENGQVYYDLDFSWDIQDTPLSGACKLDLEVLNPRSVAFGSFPCHIDPGAQKVRHWIEHLRPTATIFYDPNVRKALASKTPALREQMQKDVEELITMSDVVKVSEKDLRYLYGYGVNPDATVRRWLTKGPSLIALTQGQYGATMYSIFGIVIHIPAPHVNVVDTVGAGAAFFAALIDGLSRISLDGAEYRNNLQTISLTNLQTLGAYAATAGAISVSHSGSYLPTREELIDAHAYYQTSGTSALTNSSIHRRQIPDDSLHLI